jgi:predicted O-methyltransferase YrrM
MLELGTSLGITSAYLASAKDDSKLVTMEGSKEIAAIAQSNFEKLNVKNVSIITGNFDDQLPAFLNRQDKLDFVFIDGNHRLEPTLRYFEMLLPKTREGSILIFDDIHWSEEMEMAWKQIQHHPQVTVTVDLFFIGLVFFRKENKVKQHFLINF